MSLYPSTVTLNSRKSNQGKGDMWAPCPFHHEKTASFHVDDRKGFYYCFGCHVKGDAISFVRETENVSFIESVEILAHEARMTMPARDPKAQEKYGNYMRKCASGGQSLANAERRVEMCGIVGKMAPSEGL